MQDFVDVVCAKFEEVALSGNVVYALTDEVQGIRKWVAVLQMYGNRASHYQGEAAASTGARGTPDS